MPTQVNFRLQLNYLICVTYKIREKLAFMQIVI
jgi:hypothetical protein